MEPHFFRDGAAFRRWLAKQHASRDALWVGLHKKQSMAAGLRYADAVDEALCYGWIDGQARRIDDDRYMIRFSPRRARSVWSAVNIRKYEALAAAGRVEPAGQAAFGARDGAIGGVFVRTGGYPGVRAGAGASVPEGEAGMVLLHGSGSIVPADGKALGSERQESRHAGAPAGAAHRVFGGGRTAASPDSARSGPPARLTAHGCLAVRLVRRQSCGGSRR